MTNHSHDYEYESVEPVFDRAFYLSQYDDIKAALAEDPAFDPIRHYLDFGWREGRDPSPTFSTSDYLRTYDDVRAAGINPFFHFIVCGQAEGRISSPSRERRPVQDQFSTLSGFDRRFYFTKYPDIAEAVRQSPDFDPVLHYLQTGWREGRDPSADFSTDDYLALHPDVRLAGVNPFQHYLKWGRNEGRRPKRHPSRRIQPDPHSPAILFVGHSGHPSGAEIMLRDMIEWIADNTSYQIDILLLSGGILVEQYQRCGRTFVCSDRHHCGEDHAIKFLRSRYDLIYLNSAVSGIFCPVIEQAYPGSPPPVVMHVHEMSGMLQELSQEMEAAQRLASLFIAASEAVRTDLIDTCGIDASLIAVIHSFITALFRQDDEILRKRSEARARLGIQQEQFLLLGAGTVCERKGPDLFLKTLQHIFKERGQDAVVGVWFGDGPQLNDMRRDVEELGLQDQVRFVGFQSESRELISAADLFFLSSREDPFPLVCLEAGAFAVPTLHFSQGTGIGQLTSNGAGHAVPSFDIVAAAEAIVHLRDDRQHLRMLGMEAQKRVLSSYEREASMLSLLALIRARCGFAPAVSVIVPNYNHAAFIDQRMSSIIRQTFKDIEIIVLDDASKDDSVERISAYSYDPRLKIIVNEHNSGRAFSQWKKGLAAARGRHIWIAESDDFCSEDFLESVLPGFEGGGIAISFCRTEIVDEGGVVQQGALDTYLAGANAGRFVKSFRATGYEDVTEAMGVRCTIVNASAAVFDGGMLKAAISASDGFLMCGDWCVYLALLEKGGINYTTQAVNYFRRHSNSIVNRIEGTDIYFKERSAIARTALRKFPGGRKFANRIIRDLEGEWARFQHVDKQGLTFDDLVSPGELIDISRSNSDRRLNIAFYVHGMLFSKGGIESQCASLAKYLANKGHKVTIYCRKWNTAEPIFEVGPFVTVAPIFNEEALTDSIDVLRASLIEREIDVLIPMLSEWLFEPIVAAAEGLDIRVIASEHNDPWKIEQLWWSHDARVATFQKADIVHVLLESFRASLPAPMQQNVIAIPNGVQRPAIDRVAAPPTPRFIAIGRLAPQKGYPRLLKAMARLVQARPNATLDIFGDGPDREELQLLRDELGLNGHVRFRGVTNRVYEPLVESSALVVPSIFEGFGIVVVEAKMVGVPAIAYKDCKGPNELITDGEDGLLVEPDTDGVNLASVMMAFVDDIQLQGRLREGAFKSSGRFEAEDIFSRWDDMIRKLASEENAAGRRVFENHSPA